MSASVPMSPSELTSTLSQAGQQSPARQWKKYSMSASVAGELSALKSEVEVWGRGLAGVDLDVCDAPGCGGGLAGEGEGGRGREAGSVLEQEPWGWSGFGKASRCWGTVGCLFFEVSVPPGLS
jgi:hypothetical protein